MSKETFPHLEALRDLMRSKHIDAVIIPGTDPHQSEYPSEHWKFRDYVSGFTGSNGTAVVTLDDAGLWTDSRYFLQAAEQLEGSGFTLRKENIPGEPTVLEWLGEVLDEDAVVTSGYSSLFPEDIMVGVIVGEDKAMSSNFMAMKVKLSTDFSQLKNVSALNNKMRVELKALETKDNNPSGTKKEEKK